MDELTPPPPPPDHGADPGGAAPWGGGDGPHAGGQPSPAGQLSGVDPRGASAPEVADARGDLAFARVLGAVGIAILVLSALLLLLPSWLQGGPGVYLVAYGIAILFGPVGFWLLGEAWRIRNRARHGTTLPPGQRRGLRILGAALIAVGVFVAFSGFGASGTISTVLNLVWGLTLAGYGVRMLLRTLATERA